MSLAFTNDISSGWGGDRIVLVGKDDARVLRWVTVWDSARDAGEFYGALQQQLPLLEAAARALSGDQGGDRGGDRGKDSGVTLEYGDADREVLLNARVRAGRGDFKRVLRDLKHTLAPSGN
ncbi:MAG: hypothetical protein HOP15_17615 [Planctomycetes bacterium]|nr:hypothetical protein [Planctomycetota bacterium]